MPDYAIARRHMVDSQIRTNKVTDQRIIDALGDLPREEFLDAALQAAAYVDEDIRIDEDRCLMQPMVLARMVQALDVGPGDVALDIGCGTGYSTALLARLAATVVALESEPGLAQSANQNLTGLSVDNAVVVDGRLADGYAAQAPFDVIFFGGAVAEIPAAILRQLGEGGRICAVVRKEGEPGRVTLGLCKNGQVSFRVLFDAAIPSLPGFAPEKGFVF